jgi:hypothetical protein
MPEIREHPPSTQKMSMTDPLRGNVGDPGAYTINVKNVDSEPPGRRCWRSRSAHHQRKKYRRQDILPNFVKEDQQLKRRNGVLMIQVYHKHQSVLKLIKFLNFIPTCYKFIN